VRLDSRTRRRAEPRGQRLNGEHGPVALGLVLLYQHLDVGIQDLADYHVRQRPVEGFSKLRRVGDEPFNPRHFRV
jgi:hypothetical protein